MKIVAGTLYIAVRLDGVEHHILPWVYVSLHHISPYNTYDIRSYAGTGGEPDLQTIQIPYSCMCVLPLSSSDLVFPLWGRQSKFRRYTFAFWCALST